METSIETILLAAFFPFIFAYFLGSISFGLILSKLAGYGDIRTVGSGNVGATNVLRTGNKKLAALTLLLDALKGAFAIFVAWAVLSPSAWPYQTFLVIPYAMEDRIFISVGFAAICGHCFPIWLKFKGGKGVSTTLGVLLVATPITGIFACFIWLFVAKFFRISSLAALTSIAVTPAITYLIYGAQPALINFFIALLIFIRHEENIKRLIKGKESKINLKKKDGP